MHGNDHPIQPCQFRQEASCLQSEKMPQNYYSVCQFRNMLTNLEILLQTKPYASDYYLQQSIQQRQGDKVRREGLFRSPVNCTAALLFLFGTELSLVEYNALPAEKSTCSKQTKKNLKTFEVIYGSTYDTLSYVRVVGQESRHKGFVLVPRQINTYTWALLLTRTLICALVFSTLQCTPPHACV